MKLTIESAEQDKKREYDKAYYKANKEKILARCKEYREANKDNIHLYQKQYCIKHKACRSDYYKANKEKLQAQMKVYKEINKDKLKAQRKVFHEANREKHKIYAKNYNAINKEKNKEYKKSYYLANKEIINDRKRNYYEKNKDKIKAWAKKYYEANKDKMNICKNNYQKQRRKIDPKFKLKGYISTSVGNSLRDGKEGKSWEALVGYTLEKLKKHLEKQFTVGMTWENYGKWHLDHKIPISVFNFTKPEHRDFKKCWALKNLQPLWAENNLSKQAKLGKHFQPSLLL